ncbi:MAG: hypothetical protein PVSMB1_13670 [Gemmatimonadaceae bacterium]
MKYAFVHENVTCWTVRRLCSTLQVSRAGYYAWRKRGEGARAISDSALSTKIRAIHERSRGSYGSPRVHEDLIAEGSRHGRKRVARLMRQHGLKGMKRRRFKVTTTDSNHVFPVAPNLVERKFKPERHALDSVWVGDMTYIPTSEGFLYLAIVLDLRSREVVGWAMHPTRDTIIVIDALKMAIARRRPSAGAIFHSDRGVQYASREFRELLHAHGLRQSMSRKKNCWDNAVAESFFSTLKTELGGARRYASRAAARATIFEYIAVWYNRQRRHSAIGYTTPAATAASAA